MYAALINEKFRSSHFTEKNYIKKIEDSIEKKSREQLLTDIKKM